MNRASPHPVAWRNWGARQSGRTTAALLAALSWAERGRQVRIACPGAQLPMLSNRMKQLLASPGASEKLRDVAKRIRFAYPPMHVLGGVGIVFDVAPVGFFARMNPPGHCWSIQDWSHG